MRDEPPLVDRIAREAAAEMIVDAALADALERQLDHRKIALLTCTQAGAPEKFEHHGIGKFRCAAQAAIDRIDGAAELKRCAVELFAAHDDLVFGACRLGEPRHQGAAVLLDTLRVLAKYLG